MKHRSADNPAQVEPPETTSKKHKASLRIETEDFGLRPSDVEQYSHDVSVLDDIAFAF